MKGLLRVGALCALVGLSGDSGIAEQPQLHWGLYVHGVAVDPRVGSRFP